MIRESLGEPGGRSRIDQIPPQTRIFSNKNKESIRSEGLVSQRDKTHHMLQGIFMVLLTVH